MSDTDNQNSESDLLKFISLSLAASLVLFYFSTNRLADDFVNVAWMIPVFPIVSFVAILLFGHMDSRKGGSFALAGIGLSSVFSLAIAYDVLIQDSLHGGYVESTRTWFSGATYSFDFGTYVDALAEETKYVNLEELEALFDDKEAKIGPWFRLIKENFLNDIWKALDNLGEIGDNKIHHMGNCE